MASRLAAVVGACSAALFVPLVVPLATGRIFTLADLALLHLPARFVYARALAAGHDVAWSSAFNGGYYLHGEGQTGMYHPLHVLLYAVAPLHVAFNLEILFSYAFAFAGTALVLRRWRFSIAGALVGALSFTFSGFNLFHLVHINMVAVGVHLPWLLWATDVLIAGRAVRERLAAAAAFAAILGSAILLGFPQFVLFCGIAVFTYALWRAGELRAWSGLGWLAGATLAGGALGAVQLLPTLDVLAGSARSDPSAAFRLTYSLHPLNLLQLLTPYVFREGVHLAAGENAIHESVVYNGSFCTLALWWAIARRRQLPAPTVMWWAIALCALATVLALGEYGGVYRAVASWPLFRWFRAPARFIFLLHFGLGVVAAAVFDDLATLARRGGTGDRSIASFGLLVLSAAAVLAAVTSGNATVERGIAGATIVGGVAMLMAWSAHGRAWALVLLPIVVAADLGVWGYRYVWKGAPATLEQVAARADQPASAVSGELLYSTFESSLPVLNGFRAFDVYVGLNPARAVNAADLSVQRIAGVAWRRTAEGWTAIEHSMPRARLVTDARVSSDARRDLSSVDLQRTALVSTPVSIDVGPPGSVRVIDDVPGKLVAEVATPVRTLLVTTETHHAGWRAVGGTRALPIVRVNGDFLGCVVEPGESTVVMTFVPRSLTLGTRISGAAMAVLVAIAAWCAADAVRQRRSRRP
jgi:hypothetical protein